MSKPVSEYGASKSSCLECASLVRCRKCHEKKEPSHFTTSKVICDPCRDADIECSHCKVVKPKDQYMKNYRICRDCERIRGRDYRRGDHGKTLAKKWAEENKDHHKELKAQWYQENKGYINEKNKERYYNDPIYKLKKLCKDRILLGLKNHGLQKNNRTVVYLGCSTQYLHSWLISCFRYEMTMDNHGEYWHVDHVIPIATFTDLTDPLQSKLCFSWFNLMPLRCEENLTKNKSLDSDQILLHVQNLMKFLRNDMTQIKEYLCLCARHLTMTGNSPNTPSTTH